MKTDNKKDCLFCKIVREEIPAEIVFENESILAFKDIKPLSPIHILIIPKKHIGSINDLEESDKEIISQSIFKARDIAKDMGIAEGGYKLLYRTGENGGQEVEHIHLHLIGGAKLYEEIRPE
jgi:histidine triad (HIT) family protein